MPFVVGIYEMQISRLDAEMARLFEDYYRQAFGQVLSAQPSVHRVIPIGESVRLGMEIRPSRAPPRSSPLPAPGAWWIASAASKKRCSARPARTPWMSAWCCTAARALLTRRLACAP